MCNPAAEETKIRGNILDQNDSSNDTAINEGSCGAQGRERDGVDVGSQGQIAGEESTVEDLSWAGINEMEGRMANSDRNSPVNSTANEGGCGDNVDAGYLDEILGGEPTLECEHSSASENGKAGEIVSYPGLVQTCSDSVIDPRLLEMSAIATSDAIRRPSKPIEVTEPQKWKQPANKEVVPLMES